MVNLAWAGSTLWEDEDLLQLDEVPRVPKVPAEMILVSRRKMFA